MDESSSVPGLDAPAALAATAIGCALLGPCFGPALVAAPLLALGALSRAGLARDPAAVRRLARGALGITAAVVAVWVPWLWFVLETVLF